MLLVVGYAFGVYWLASLILAWICKRSKPDYYYVLRAPHGIPIHTAVLIRHKDGRESIDRITGAGYWQMKEFGSSMAWICGDDDAPSGDAESNWKSIHKI